MGHPSLGMFQLVLFLPQRMPVSLLHFRVHVGKRQREGCSGPLCLYSQSCKWRKDSFSFRPLRHLAQLSSRQPLADLFPLCSEISLGKYDVGCKVGMVTIPSEPAC